MGPDYISVITAISFILWAEPPPPVDPFSSSPGYISSILGWGPHPNLTPPNLLFPWKHTHTHTHRHTHTHTHTLRSLSMPRQKLLLTSVLNTPEDRQSVATDRTSKQPLRGSLERTCSGHHEGNRNLKLWVQSPCLSEDRLWRPGSRPNKPNRQNAGVVVCDLGGIRQSCEHYLFVVYVPKGWFKRIKQIKQLNLNPES